MMSDEEEDFHDASATGTAVEAAESSESSEESSDEEDEPMLKYQRLQGNVLQQLVRDEMEKDGFGDRVSCLLVCKTFLLLGTEAGSVVQMDLEGNLLRRHLHHRGKVTGLSIDQDGQVFASCSDDGRVVISNNLVDNSTAGSTAATSGARKQTEVTKPQVHNFYHPIRAIQLEPLYSQNREKVFVVGGVSGKLLMKKKGWFSSHETEIHRGEGTISNILWRGRFIAWANDMGVKIYDYLQEQRIAYIDRPTGSGPSSGEQSVCHMVWENDQTLLIAWADCVKIVSIRERTRDEMLDDPSALPRCAELVSLYEFAENEVISGLTPFGPSHLALLVYIYEDQNVIQEGEDSDSELISYQAEEVLGDSEDEGTVLNSQKNSVLTRGSGQSNYDDENNNSEEQEEEDDSNEGSATRSTRQRTHGHGRRGGHNRYHRGQGTRPELRVISRETGDEVSIEALPIYDFENNRDRDYNLACNHEHVFGVGGKPIMYVQAPRDVVLAKPRNVDDHISWALRIGAFEKALELAETAEAKERAGQADPLDKLQNYSLRGLQDKLLASLLSEGEFEKAASLCPRFLDVDRDRWLQWATKFENYQMLDCLAGYLPVRNPQLPPVVYESVLFELLTKKDFDAFVRIIRQWQTLLYNHTKAQMYLKGMDELVEQEENGDASSKSAATNSQQLNSLLSSTLSVHSNKKDAKTRSASGGIKYKSFASQRELIKVQPLYNVKVVIDKVNAMIKASFGKVPRSLRDALAELYGADGQYNLALREYLEGSAMGDNDSERSDGIFAMVERHGLLSSVQDKIQQLVRLDTDKTINMLVNSLPAGMIGGSAADEQETHAQAEQQIASIVYQLGGNRDGSLNPGMDLKPLHKFLHALFTRRLEEYNNERMGPFQNMQVKLYARFDEQHLQDFVETANYYSLEEALHVCENHKPEPLYQEMVFILGRMGGYENVQRALAIILDNLRSVHLAIEFVEREGEADLWNSLVEYCVKDPILVGDLLSSAGGHNVDAVQLIQHIRSDMPIPGLSSKLDKLFDDIHLQKHFRQGCNDILKADVVDLLRSLYRRRKRAVHVHSVPSSDKRKKSPGQRCGVCKQHISSQPRQNDIKTSAKSLLPQVIVFASGHTYHHECIDTAAHMLPIEDVQDENLSINEIKRPRLRHCMIYARKQLSVLKK